MEFKNQKGQVIGTFKEGIFRKIVNRDKHLMRIYDAWGIQYDVVSELHKLGCTEIRIRETKENVVYTIPFADFFSKSQVSNFGDGQQAFCPRSLFTRIGKKEEKPLVVRNNREQLIADIVERTEVEDKHWLARRLAIAMNTLKWTDTDLHALLKKADDPTVRNYTALVQASCTIKG